MFKFFWFFVFSWLLLDVTVGNDASQKKQIYYKQSVATAAVTPSKSVSKEEINIAMEGRSQFQKTVPRKGVLDKSFESIDNNDTLIHPPIVNPTKNNTNSTVTITTEKPAKLHVAPVEEVQETQETIPQKTTRKPKPKPTLTIGGKEADGPIPASPTIKSPISMPRNIDYFVPAIITFTVLPLMGFIFYVLYKRGRDYWSKRHYRRMDFLIDGMYNE